MHIEKNICDNVLGTVINIHDKLKNNINARRDLINISIRKELHLKKYENRVMIPHAYFMLYGVPISCYMEMKGKNFVHGN